MNHISTRIVTPKTFNTYSKQHPVTYGYYQTPAGVLKISLLNKEVFNASFITDQEIESSITYLKEKDITALLLVGTEFQIKVWQASLLLKATTNYQVLANNIGHPKAHRAVANALGQNKIAYFVPCHQVLRKDGNLGGYKWGINKKQLLLNLI